jgi:hypothetical protein
MLKGMIFDLATSFEVAEHLPKSTADRYVSQICRLAPIVVFSAATLGQGGLAHINEQPHSYWVELFAKNGFASDQGTSSLFAEAWRKNDVAWFYHQNVMVFRQSSARI